MNFKIAIEKLEEALREDSNKRDIVAEAKQAVRGSGKHKLLIAEVARIIGVEVNLLKQAALAAHLAGDYILSRADLSYTMNQNDVKASLIRYINAEFHCIKAAR